MRPYRIGEGSSANLSFEVQSGSVQSGSGEGVSEEKDQFHQTPTHLPYKIREGKEKSYGMNMPQ